LVQRQVRFNRVPEKVPEKVWEALVQSQVRFNRVPKKVPEKGFGQKKISKKVPEKVLEALVQSQVKFNRVPEKVPGEGLEALRWSVVSLQSLPGSPPAGPAKSHLAFLNREQVCNKARKRSRYTALVEKTLHCTETHAPGPSKQSSWREPSPGPC